ncbi:UNVERIFIED_CONTAM: hypothetical protein RMT77_013597 [Armadillidium vulgare]|uniref:Signal recognition particle 9 kDa protein n=1 Tax=Armadillidium nasatum TaxID=96803 RepID=A0A5N5TD75_9CRUS|nr:Signal recognition particle protein [Armadillidium nasatum]RXG72333.1 Signal recognition particle 9 kDa protein [Armadillidium vulgare]
MVYLEIYEDFERAAERLYLNAPMKTRCVLKYDHSKGCFKVKVTDNDMCIQFKTDSQQELKKIEKLMSSLIKHMASNSEDK